VGGVIARRGIIEARTRVVTRTIGVAERSGIPSVLGEILLDLFIDLIGSGVLKVTEQFLVRAFCCVVGEFAFRNDVYGVIRTSCKIVRVFLLIRTLDQMPLESCLWHCVKVVVWTIGPARLRHRIERRGKK